MLRVEAIGNIGADPEQRYTQKGSQVVSFNVAINQVKYDKDGERQESTEWFRVRVMGRQTEYASKLTKGTRVYINGRLDISHFERKDGTQGIGFDIWADEVQNAGGRRESEEDGDVNHAGNRRESATAARTKPASNSAAAEELEDLPF